MCCESSGPIPSNHETMPVRASRRATSSSSQPPFILYNPTSQEYSGQTVSVTPQSHRDSIVCCSPFMNMGIVHKLCSKVLKMSHKHPEYASDPTPGQGRQSNDNELRPSRSRSSRRPSASHEPTRPKPIYRGSSPLKKADIHVILDISAEAIQENVERSWPQTGRFSSDEGQRYRYDEQEESTTISLRHQPSRIDTSFIDTSFLDTSFTLSDTHTSDTRHDSPSTSKVKLPSPIEFPYPSPEDLLPPNPYFERLEREKEKQRQSQASPTAYRQRSLHHTRTTTASFSKPTPLAYPTLASNQSSHNAQSSISLNAVETGPSGNARAYQRQPVTSSPARYTPFPTASPIRSPSSSPTQLSSLSLDSHTRARPHAQQPRPVHRQPTSPITKPIIVPNGVPQASVPRRATSSLTTNRAPPLQLTRTQSTTRSNAQLQSRPHTASSALPSNSKLGSPVATPTGQPQRQRHRGTSVSSSGTERSGLARSTSTTSRNVNINANPRATGSPNVGRTHLRQISISAHNNTSSKSLPAPIPF
ncbi:hypothetical protein BDN72DRAFT_122420 [Pluteus cervinus]|uniref:Uncharacterized protein n=1 Tax=Pluteus cervinus TaxID=181527 RepID=A0ACD3B7K5_9AGAR|nr:hypothetical protein BDN72DRAFT_122420 [Pluteus cervinus]